MQLKYKRKKEDGREQYVWINYITTFNYCNNIISKIFTIINYIKQHISQVNNSFSIQFIDIIYLNIHITTV